MATRRAIGWAVLGVWLLMAPGAVAAVFHRTASGTMKDNCIVWHQGTFYMFSMYQPDGGEWKHVWLATSPDGVHWTDVGRVIKDMPWQVYAMRVWKVGDEFLMNHGSFTGDKQDVLRFWHSSDLLHWEYQGESYDVRRPDGQRLDHMDVISVEEQGRTQWYGYACGGLLRSDDGRHWRWVADYEAGEDQRGGLPLYPVVSGMGEPGGGQQIGDKFYLLSGGAFPGDLNYAVATYVADRPQGPFRPDYPAFRFCGNSGHKIVLVWAHFCRKPDELLIANYLYEPDRDAYCMPSLKKAVVDPQGHLRMGYWPGNEAVKGREIPLDWSACRLESPTADGVRLTPGTNRVELVAKPHRSDRFLRIEDPVYAVAMNGQRFDLQRGIVLEGTLRLDGVARQRIGGLGLCFEEGPQTGTAVLLQGWGLTEIGKLTWSAAPQFTCEDRTGFGAATVAGIPEGQTCRFRLFFRQNLFELYLDDRLVQIFATEHATGRIGLVLHDSTGQLSDLRAWEMNLSE